MQISHLTPAVITDTSKEDKNNLPLILPLLQIDSITGILFIIIDLGCI